MADRDILNIGSTSWVLRELDNQTFCLSRMSLQPTNAPSKMPTLEKKRRNLKGWGGGKPNVKNPYLDEEVRKLLIQRALQENTQEEYEKKEGQVAIQEEEEEEKEEIPALVNGP
jgi:hypothetical protein